ncbi:MAG: STAS/SEC14 domain-containing protein [Terrimicrobiaceae bacterium]|nr:STAS/SEC14 domain-containing protein [Terrimicrobiaceae bacterium]
MHSYFPHPNDRVIVLRVHNEPNSADTETVRSLLESRVKQHGRILMLLDADCSEDAFGNWIAALFDGIGIEGVERFAIVGEGVILSCEILASSEVVRRFTPAQREQALNWIQTGGMT